MVWKLFRANYFANHWKSVEGWIDGRHAHTLVWLNAVQRSLAVRGGVMEIGVHHGRFFLPLNAMVDEGEGPSFAVDLFEMQDLNIDKSGHGNLAIFRSHLARLDRHAGRNVEFVRADSTRLRFDDLSRFTQTRPKIVSIDGGHTTEHTLSDLALAQAVVHDKGAVFVDDILNLYWPGVIEGVITYLQQRPVLWPVMIGYNKLIMVPMSHHEAYLKRLSKHAPPATKLVSLCGYRMLAL
jgi:cephalosporin hydroxylase